MSNDGYVHGHHESVLRSHSWRTVENSAAHLIAHLHPGLRVLDAGCGPGTITADLATRVAPGEVIGIDESAEIIERAAADYGETAAFRVGDVYALDADDDSFDIVHAHQLLQHLRDPVAALAEMRRVVRPGGIVAVRDADYGAMAWAPQSAGLDRWMALYRAMTANNGQNADAGRHLLGWAHAAGFTTVRVTSSNWTFADPEARRWWADPWADRVRHSSYRTTALEQGLADDAELEAIAAAWHAWAAHPDGFFLCPHGELIAVK